MNFVTGQAVRISVCGRTVNGTVLLASPNGASLMLEFDAGLWVGGDRGMYAGQMPVLKGDDGVFRDLIASEPVSIEACWVS